MRIVDDFHAAICDLFCERTKPSVKRLFLEILTRSLKSVTVLAAFDVATVRSPLRGWTTQKRRRPTKTLSNFEFRLEESQNRAQGLKT